MGTPGYLSPEQCCGEPAGPRSDIYSLGMTFYEMLTGSMPFKGESPLAVLRQILDVDPPPLLQVDPDLDPRIASVVERMVAKEPNDRYQTCHELIADLGEVLGSNAGGTAALGVPRSAALRRFRPRAPVPTSGRTQMKVTGRPEEAPTATPAAAAALRRRRPAGRRRRAPRPLAAGAAAAEKSGSGGNWLLIAAMAVMLVVAVSAAGLYLAAPMLKDAPFLRDAPFFKNASLLEDGTAATEVAASPRRTTPLARRTPGLPQLGRERGGEGRSRRSRLRAAGRIG